MVTSACSPVGPRPPVPQDRNAWAVFDEEGRDAWLAFDVDVPGRDSRGLVRSFLASARALGCDTAKGGHSFRGYSAVLAECHEGTIVMAAMDYERVRLACLKPTTRQQCEALVGQIGMAR
jgi:hypothetical protein